MGTVRCVPEVAPPGTGDCAGGRCDLVRRLRLRSLCALAVCLVKAAADCVCQWGRSWTSAKCVGRHQGMSHLAFAPPHPSAGTAATMRTSCTAAAAYPRR